MFDNGEFNLYKIAREVALNFRGAPVRAVLGTIKDQRRLIDVFRDTKPEIVFHAAAFKHVPLLESNCYEAFVNNVVGTRNLLQIAVQSDVERFVMISTDKAVDPSSIMGNSKRLAELAVQSYQKLADQRGGAHPQFNAAVVRFGNVINSNGSVVPLFREQILSGGPVTVTHPEMERFFMSIREAVRLVLTAGTLGERGEIYILDMGKPIRIVDVARKMLALYGRRDIPIVFTGIRPGEKLTEDLVSDGEMRSPTRFRKVSKVIAERELAGNVRTWITTMESRIERISDAEIGQAMRAMVQKFDRELRGESTARPAPVISADALRSS
jgi:FlaA1/EpsC-like NDP-sugar epimerase